MKKFAVKASAFLLSLVMIFSLNIPAMGALCLFHNFSDWKVSKIATCKEKGEISRTCSKCDYTEVLATEMTHNFADTTVSVDCTKGGYIKTACATCGLVEKETPFEKAEHLFGASVTEKEATCTEDGLTATTCTVCGFREEKITAKSGHKVAFLEVVKEATCTEKGIQKYTCTLCTADIEEEIPALGHDETIIKGVPATCTTDGISDGKYCPRCDTTYEEQKPLSALGHEKVVVPQLDPTCTQSGLTESTVCKNCGYLYEKSETIPAKGHRKVTAPAVTATCVNVGLTEGEKCADCDYFFVPQQEIPKPNHAHEILAAVPPTCTKTGLTQGAYCRTCDVVTLQQTVVPPAGHSEVSYKELAPTCEESGYYAGKRCSVCGIIISGLGVIPPLGHTEEVFPEEPADCTTSGRSERRICLVCNKVTKEREILPATGHSIVVDYAVSANCQRTGLTEGRHCLKCKTVIVEQKEVPKTDHHIVTTEALEATCTASGKTSGEKCAVCDLITKSPKTTLPLGHTIKSRLSEATTSNDGALETYCERCDKVISSTPIKQIKSIKLSKTKYTYDGKSKKPSVTVTDTDGKKLILNTDYTLKYSSGRTNPGIYKVKVTFKGNYSGSKTLSFTIIPEKTTVTAKQSASAIKLTWKAVTGAYGYRVYQYNEKTGKWVTVIKTTKETSYTFKSLDSGTTYKYSVKPYAKGDSTIWGGSTRITVTTKPATPSITSLDAPSKGTATLKWGKVTGATGYVVYYTTSKNGSYKKLGSTKENVYTNSKLKSNRTYYFKIKAYIKTSSGNIYSGASTAKTVYVK